MSYYFQYNKSVMVGYRSLELHVGTICFWHLQMNRIVRKPDFCLCENKGADQLRGNREADQRLYFRYTDSIFPLLLISEISSFCDCTGQFVSDLVGNPEDRFSRVAAQMGQMFHDVAYRASTEVKGLY